MSRRWLAAFVLIVYRASSSTGDDHRAELLSDRRELDEEIAVNVHEIRSRPTPALAGKFF